MTSSNDHIREDGTVVIDFSKSGAGEMYVWATRFCEEFYVVDNQAWRDSHAYTWAAVDDVLFEEWKKAGDHEQL